MTRRARPENRTHAAPSDADTRDPMGSQPRRHSENPFARHTPAVRRTTAPSRSPGLRRVTRRRLPESPWIQWLRDAGYTAYSCGGSPGIDPVPISIPPFQFPRGNSTRGKDADKLQARQWRRGCGFERTCIDTSMPAHQYRRRLRCLRLRAGSIGNPVRAMSPIPELPRSGNRERPSSMHWASSPGSGDL